MKSDAVRNFQRLAAGVEILQLSHAIQRAPELWNANRLRTRFENSPHAEADDILLRFEDLAEVDPLDSDIEAKVAKAPRIFQPAWHALPSARTVIMPLLASVGAYELSRCMVTRLRPGAQIAAHADVRGEYANLPDIARYHIVLRGLPGSLFHCGAETVNMQTGEVWWFNAREVHAVVNNSTDDRVHLLVDCRIAP